jgi:ABC-type nitrate/sulfonate/bicarbonate transport system substrate-binding protein
MKTSTKFLGVVAALAVAAGALIFFSNRQTPTPPSPAQQPATPARVEDFSFRLKWIIYSSFAHHFVALDKGYFKQEGLNVTIQPGGAGIDPIKLVASGADDVGLAGYAQILMAREKGIPVIAIAEEYVKSGVVAMSLKNSGITKPQDFVGKTVGIVPGSDPTIVYQALIAKLGIDRTKINEVPIGFDLIPLFEKKIDATTVAYISNQPIVAEDKGFPVNIINPEDYGVSVGGNVFFTSEKALAERRPALKRFLRAALRGIVASQQMSDEDVVKIVLAHNDKLNEATERKIWKVSKEVLLSHDPKSVGLMPAETWQRTADIFKQEGLLKTSPDLKKCYSNELVEEILREGLLSDK